jgi:WD40 repeat protein/Cdc6-like AAA superfamily ATPase
MNKLDKNTAWFAIEKYIEKFKGTEEAKRLKILGELMSDDGEIQMERALNQLFNGTDKTAMDSLRKSRQIIKNNSESEKLGFELAADNNRKNSPLERILWFKGEGLLEKEAIEYFKNVSTTTTTTTQNYATGDPTTKRYFVSYAHGDQTKAKDFLDIFSRHLNTSSKYNFKKWIDKDIIVAKDWEEQIETAINECDFGLFLLSAGFFNSDFITGRELKRFIKKNSDGSLSILKSFVPVALKSINQNGDLLGLEKVQIFSYNGKCFSEFSGNNKEKFAIELMNSIEVKLKNEFEKGPEPGKKQSIEQEDPSNEEIFFSQFKDAEFNEIQKKPAQIMNRAHAKSKLSESENALATGSGEKTKALDLINDWLENGKNSVYALLGDFGMGKTFTSKMFCQEQIQKYKNKESSYFPFYFDLRNLDLKEVENSISIEKVLNSILNKSKSIDSNSTIDFSTVSSIRKNRVTVTIIDGIDEVLPHLDTRRQNLLLTEFWKLVPDFRSKLDNKEPEGKKHKIILSCRTHFFKSVTEQAAFFRGNERGMTDEEKDFSSCILLPFDEGQIAEYLKQTFPGKDEKVLIQTLKEVHNLFELSQRPVLLDFITEIIGEIEEMKKEGKAVTISVLYDKIIERAFLRDEGKHEIGLEIKKEALEKIAAFLWNRKTRRIAVEELEKHLAKVLSDGTPDMKKLFLTKNSDTLYKDLRNATLLIRSNERDFGFVHTSIHEYFLAKHISRSLADGLLNELAVDKVSPETIDFVLDIIKLKPSEDREPIVQNLKTFLAEYHPKSSELLFEIWLTDAEKQEKLFQRPEKMKFIGTSFKKWKFTGNENPLDLRNIQFENVHFGDAVFENTILNDTKFSDCTMSLTEIHNSKMDRVIISNCFISGFWRNVTGYNCSFPNMKMDFVKVINSHFQQVAVHPLEFPQLINSDFENKMHKKITFRNVDRVEQLNGHVREVNHCEISADGKRALSASWDNSLIYWDLDKGEILHRLEGHSSIVSHCEISADGKRALSASWDNSLITWDLDKGEILHRLVGHSAPVNHCEISADGKRALSASRDSTLIYWDLEKGEILHRLEGHSHEVNHCEISADGKRALSASDDDTLIYWDLDKGEILHRLEGHSHEVNHCEISADGKRALSASRDSTLIYWDLEKGEILHRLEGHSHEVNHCEISSDGKRALSASDDDTLIYWDLDKGEILHRLAGHSNWVNHCEISADGKRALSASGDNSLIYWDLEKGEILHSLAGHSDWVNHCEISADGKRALSASWDNSLIYWDLDKGEILHRLAGHSGSVTHCEISADGKRALSASEDRNLIYWDLDKGEILHRLEGHSHEVNHCEISSDGKRALSASWDNSLIYWDLEKGEILHRLAGHSGSVTHCEIFADGKRALSASNDNTLKTWDLEKGEILHSLAGHSATVTHCEISADGKRALSASNDSTLITWDLDKVEILHRLAGHSGTVTHCEISADGKRALSASEDRSLIYWDLDKGEILHRLAGHSNWVNHCEISADGKRALSASWDNSLIYWDLDKGEILHRLAGHSGTVTHCEISADGKRALSASEDRNLIYWDLDKGEILHRLEGHSHEVNHCEISSDGKRALSASWDNSLIYWDLEKGEILHQTAHIPNGYVIYKNNQILSCSENAWRYLRWKTKEGKYLPFDAIEI